MGTALLAINACAIAFVERNQINSPNTPIPINEQYSQACLMQEASQAFCYVGKAERTSPLSLSLSLPPTSLPVNPLFTRRCLGRKRQAEEDWEKEIRNEIISHSHLLVIEKKAFAIRFFCVSLQKSIPAGKLYLL